jgi:hypothetical protein
MILEGLKQQSIAKNGFLPKAFNDKSATSEQ